MNTIIENQTSLSAYYNHPRNIHILNKGARYLQSLNNFVCNCIYSETTILSPNIFEQHIISRCTNMDDYCELIHQFVQTLSGFPQTYENNRTNPPLQKDSDSESRLYHLSHTQVTALLNFVQKYDIISKNKLKSSVEFFQTFHKRRNQLLFECLSPNKNYQTLISFLNNNFKYYRSSKKAKSITQITVQEKFSLRHETSELNFSNTLTSNILLTGGSEQPTLDFDSQSNHDIIIMYEKAVKQILHYVLNHTTTIEDSITALVTERYNRLHEIYLAIFEWLDKRHLHKKNARILLNELNNIHFSAWNDADQRYILEKLNNLKEIKAIPHREYQIIKKLISKGI